MAHDTTTQNPESYALRLELHVPSVSPFQVGRAIEAAMRTMPDDTFNWTFDPFQGDEKELTLPLMEEGQVAGDEARQIGSLKIIPIQVGVVLDMTDASQPFKLA